MSNRDFIYTQSIIDRQTGEEKEVRKIEYTMPNRLRLKDRWTKVFARVSELRLSPHFLGRLTLLVQFLESKTNLLRISEKDAWYYSAGAEKLRDGPRPMDKIDMKSIFHKSRRVVDDFVQVSIKKGIMAQVGTNQNPNYYINPTYFLNGSHVTIDTFLLFKDDPMIYHHIRDKKLGEALQAFDISSRYH